MVPWHGLITVGPVFIGYIFSKFQYLFTAHTMARNSYWCIGELAAVESDKTESSVKKTPP